MDMKRNSKLKIFLWVAAIISTLAIILVISNIKSNAEEAENCSREKRLPVLMYHLILKNPGNSNKFIVPQSVFEEDLNWQNAQDKIEIRNGLAVVSE